MFVGLLTLAVVTAQVASNFVARGPSRAPRRPQPESASPEVTLAELERRLAPIEELILAAAPNRGRFESRGFLNTVVTTASQVTGYLVEHAPRLRPDPFTGQLIAAALQARTAQPEGPLPGRGIAEPLTPAELRVLKLLPTSSYLQIAETLYISRNTVKVHLRAVYQKLGVTSRSQALERAVDLHLL